LQKKHQSLIFLVISVILFNFIFELAYIHFCNSLQTYQINRSNILNDPLSIKLWSNR
jgi:hypothetical protein